MSRAAVLVVDGRKPCSVCKGVKLVAEFARDVSTASGYTTACKACRSTGAYARTKRWREKNPERYLALQRDWYDRVGRFKRLAAAYGVTDEQYAAMLEAQDGVCAICQSDGGKRALAVDHDHKTKHVRGLLCVTCNSAIGMLREEPSLFEAAVNYLKNGGSNGR